MNQERIYTVLREPHISEKVSVLGDLANQYAFKVAPDATRAEVREAVEAIFKVSVTKVTTANVKGKVKRNARGITRKKNWMASPISVSLSLAIAGEESVTPPNMATRMASFWAVPAISASPSRPLPQRWIT